MLVWFSIVLRIFISYEKEKNAALAKHISSLKFKKEKKNFSL